MDPNFKAHTTDGRWTQNIGESFIKSVTIDGHTVTGRREEDAYLENEDFSLKVLLASWNEAAGPLAAQLYTLRCDETSLFSLLDKDDIRTIIHYVYPKPPMVAQLLVVPLSFWFAPHPL